MLNDIKYVIGLKIEKRLLYAIKYISVFLEKCKTYLKYIRLESVC